MNGFSVFKFMNELEEKIPHYINGTGFLDMDNWIKSQLPENRYYFKDDFGVYTASKYLADGVYCFPHHLSGFRQLSQTNPERGNWIDKAGVFAIGNMFQGQNLSFTLEGEYATFDFRFPITLDILDSLVEEWTVGNEKRHIQHFIKQQTSIYLIKDDDSGFTKIGRSINPFGRLKTLKTQKTLLPKPHQFHIIHHWRDFNLTETLLHNQFADKRIRGEWFNLDSFDVSRIRRYSDTRKQPEPVKYFPVDEEYDYDAEEYSD